MTMEVLLQHPKGGKKLEHLKLHFDTVSGKLGYLLGYLESGEKVILPYSRAVDVAQYFTEGIKKYEKKFDDLIPKPKFKEKVRTFLLSKLQDN